MARVKKYLDTRQSDNHERWLVSYADFITLLFAFFVVMYAVSSVNENKYRTLSEAIGNAFGGSTGEQAASGLQANSAQTSLIINQRRAALQRRQQEQLRDIARGVNTALAPLVAEGQVRVIQSPRGITVEINASALFAPGQAVLHEASRKSLRAVAEAIKLGDQTIIQVEGHTDDIRISNPQFPSNWELSAARASSVVRLFVESGIDPRRLAAVGYGEFRSIGSNATAEGRARNRRVSVMILAADPDRPGAAAEPFTPMEFPIRPN